MLQTARAIARAIARVSATCPPQSVKRQQGVILSFPEARYRAELAWRPVQQHSCRWFDAYTLEELRIKERQLNALAQLSDLLPQTAYHGIVNLPRVLRHHIVHHRVHLHRYFRHYCRHCLTSEQSTVPQRHQGRRADVRQKPLLDQTFFCCLIQA